MNGDDDGRTYFDDIEAGTVVSCGSTTVSEDDIVEFAEQFDPLDIHTDPEAAAESQHGGIIASGYHTLSLSVRLLVDEIRSERAVVGGLGIDDVRWHEPVRPGDTLTVENEVLDTRVSESNPETGIVHEAITVTNQDGVTVLSLENRELVERSGPD
ncbi:MaoC family dehydratase [Halostella pelagica]|uniref:MaoC family dehydratase n=1 Tax=Halostella pelagica TaxID=2583824 RepID=UPI0010817149|nr:MaoC family dehydratase [Halostella pelagica]